MHKAIVGRLRTGDKVRINSALIQRLHIATIAASATSDSLTWPNLPSLLLARCFQILLTVQSEGSERRREEFYELLRKRVCYKLYRQRDVPLVLL